MSDDIAIKVENLSKCYPIFDQPRDRLKQMILPRLLGPDGEEPRRYYREFWALNDVSFEVRKGESLGILGRNGSGKSTLLQIIAGTLAATSGRSTVRGRVVALLELGSGFNPEFTGEENIYLTASLYGLSHDETRKRFSNIVEFAEIGDFLKQPIKTYSSGMTMRLAFSILTQVDADILIVDEALAVGDVFFVQKCMQFIRDFALSHTFVLVSHSTEAVTSLCNKALWLKEGRLMYAGSPKECAEQYICDVQGFSMRTTNNAPTVRLRDAKAAKHDMRREFLATSQYQNSIEVFEFKSTSSNYGTGEAEIIDVALLHAKTRQPLSFIVGGEEAAIAIRVRARVNVHDIIIGFVLKDSRGQRLFGDNTFLTHRGENASVLKGQSIAAEFHFQMPYLPAGDYMLHAAAARGTQDAFVHMHSLPNALPFKSHIAHFSDGLVGVPMKDIRLKLSDCNES
jgi:lipopolysaccharide transport system ATP-binding protein